MLRILLEIIRLASFDYWRIPPDSFIPQFTEYRLLKKVQIRRKKVYPQIKTELKNIILENRFIRNIEVCLF